VSFEKALAIIRVQFWRTVESSTAGLNRLAEVDGEDSHNRSCTHQPYSAAGAGISVATHGRLHRHPRFGAASLHVAGRRSVETNGERISPRRPGRDAADGYSSRQGGKQNAFAQQSPETDDAEPGLLTGLHVPYTHPDEERRLATSPGAQGQKRWRTETCSHHASALARWLQSRRLSAGQRQGESRRAADRGSSRHTGESKRGKQSQSMNLRDSRGPPPHNHRSVRRLR
jgi:hypothetical protein